MEGNWRYSETQDDEHRVQPSWNSEDRTIPFQWYIISLWASCNKVWRLFTFTPSDSSRAPLRRTAPGMCPKTGRFGTKTWNVSRAIAWPTYTDYLCAALLARLIFIYLHFFLLSLDLRHHWTEQPEGRSAGVQSIQCLSWCSVLVLGVGLHLLPVSVECVLALEPSGLEPLLTSC
jgi:hypothetical protein